MSQGSTCSARCHSGGACGHHQRKGRDHLQDSRSAIQTPIVGSAYLTCQFRHREATQLMATHFHPLWRCCICASRDPTVRGWNSQRHQEHGLVVVWLLLLECQQVAGSGASPKTVFVLSQLLPGNPSHMSPFRGQDGLTSLTCSCGQAGQSLCFLPLRSMSMRDAVAQILLPLTYTPYRMRTAVSEGNEGRDELLNQK